jgi:hypothetical protein
MKAASLILGLALVSVFALSLAPGASAATEVMAPGEVFTKSVHADLLDSIDYSWSVSPSTASVNFVITMPGDVEYDNHTGNSYSFFVMATLSGDYVFKWTNPGVSSVTLTYDIEGDSGIGGAFDTALLILIIIAVVIVIIVVVAIVLVLRGGKKAQPAQPGYPQTGAPQTPFMGNACPKCGSSIDAQQSFCPKCGFRVR